MNLVSERVPPQKRASYCDGKFERHLPEAAVMLAVAQWIFALGADSVSIRPDVMHTKGFNIRAWLEGEGFERVAPEGTTQHAGRYVRDSQSVLVAFRPGHGDVVACIKGRQFVVEAKGGCINTRHPGQVSKLRRHLHEAVGMLLGGHDGADRLIAAVPKHAETTKLAGRIARNCRSAGIEITLISGDGSVEICE